MGTHLLEIYGRHLDSNSDDQTAGFDWHNVIRMERRMSLTALQAERDALKQLRKSKNISEHNLHPLVQELDLKEEALKLALH